MNNPGHYYGKQSSRLGNKSDVYLAKVGRYHIKQPIGAGAMADVFLAYDPKINRMLAIKLLKPEHLKNKEFRTRFLREAEAAGKLDHPHIATVYDVGDLDATPYMVMELLDGRSLESWMLDEYNFSTEQILDIGIQLAEALDFAHSKGVVHRDIKPGNIVCTDGVGNVKITDFGVAKLTDDHEASAGEVGLVLGTPNYMSPEQIMGDPVDGRTDLFSIGVILYELAAGHKPFTEDTIISLFAQIVNETYTRMEDLSVDVPPGLSKIIGKCLRSNPDRRFQSGKELATALTRLKNEITSTDLGLNQTQMLRTLWGYGRISLRLQLQRYKLKLLQAWAKKLEPKQETGDQTDKAQVEKIERTSQRQEKISALQERITRSQSLKQIYRSQLLIPMRLIWISAMSLIVGITIVTGTVVIYKAQTNSMKNFVLDSGASLAKMIAIESAEPLLSEDWVSVEALIEDLSQNQEFVYLLLLDHTNTVRGKALPNYIVPGDLERLPEDHIVHSEVQVRDWQTVNKSIFDFSTPVTFQNKKIGVLKMGLSQQELQEAAKTTLGMMLVLMVVTLSAAVGMTALIISRIRRPIDRLNKALDYASQGHLHGRINELRTDEFGALYNKFNTLMDEVEDQLHEQDAKQP